MQRRYTDEQISSFVAEALRDGFYVLKGHFSREKLEQWQAACLPLLQQQIELEGGNTSRGANRYYVTFPFAAPFADPAIYQDPDIIAIVEQLVGKNFVMCQLASDTPMLGSDYQEIHRDCPPLFPETGVETPMYQLALNFPLVDVTAQNGPLEIIRGTHLMNRQEGLRLVENKEASIESISMQLGDVMIRDVRTLHRGTPNRTEGPRPMVVIGYSRSWLNRPEVSINVPRDEYENLSDFARNMLRNNPVTDEIDLRPKPESYTVFQY
ncbi:MAG TPA: phytanoyl-CoA dioxygenase family protein [Bacteriovoracaceae bacterium]|nr:phytanoyl-CoA dioxygenase family protein [Bacteriovoracaceae bacterium]